LMNNYVAEFIGTAILILLGNGVVANVVLRETKGNGGGWIVIAAGWGFAVYTAVLCVDQFSGAHLNPAVTVALAVHRQFPWSKVLPYSLAQMGGAFVASALVFATYREALSAFDGGIRAVEGATATAGIFATYPQPYLSIAGGFVDQVVGTMLLMAGVLAVTDQKNVGAPAWLVGPLVGGIVVAIGVAFGFNAGYAINPARDFGPRLFTFVAGWGSGVFTAGGGWWWVPIVAPIVGAILGAFLYDALINKHHLAPEAGR